MPYSLPTHVVYAVDIWFIELLYFGYASVVLQLIFWSLVTAVIFAVNRLQLFFLKFFSANFGKNYTKNII